MAIIIGWLLKTALGRIVGGIGAAALLSGLLWAGCSVKSCMEAKEEVKQYHRADQIRQKEDPKIDKFIGEQKKRVDQTPGEFNLDRELERLRQHGAGAD